MSHIFSKSLFSLGALSMLALAGIATTESASAQEALCSMELRTCQKHCVRTYGGGSWGMCRYRVCGPQFETCMATLWTPNSRTYVFVAPRPRGPSGNPGPSNPGPFPPKGPGPVDLPPTSNGNGGIVPQGHRPGNGGIVPADHRPAGGIVPTAHSPAPSPSSSEKR